MVETIFQWVLLVLWIFGFGIHVASHDKIVPTKRNNAVPNIIASLVILVIYYLAGALPLRLG